MKIKQNLKLTIRLPPIKRLLIVISLTSEDLILSGKEWKFAPKQVSVSLFLILLMQLIKYFAEASHLYLSFGLHCTLTLVKGCRPSLQRTIYSRLSSWHREGTSVKKFACTLFFFFLALSPNLGFSVSVFMKFGGCWQMLMAEGWSTMMMVLQSRNLNRL